MQLKYSKEPDILLIRFSDNPISESDEPKPGLIIDYDKDGNVVRIEILDASKRVQAPFKLEYEVVS
ncbi:MAG: DUF2283 domain-containing protein [Saprospirales bacterium]|nr:DUF2283 domain-containing protein [Saprospirales bacterium]